MSMSYVLSGTKPRSSKTSSKKSKHVKYDVSSSGSSSSSDASSMFEDPASTYTVSTSTERSHRPGYKRHKKQLRKSKVPLDEVIDDYRRKPDANIGWECYEEPAEIDKKGRKVKVIVWQRVDSMGQKHIKEFRIRKDGSAPKHRNDSFEDSGLGTSVSSNSESESDTSLIPTLRSRHSPHRAATTHRHHRSEAGHIHEKITRIPQQPKTNIVLKAGKNIYMGDHSPEPKGHSRRSNHRRKHKTRRRAMRLAQPRAWENDLVQRRIVTTEESWEEPFRWPWSRSKKDIRQNYKKRVYSDDEWEYEAKDLTKGKGIAGRGRGIAPARPGQYLKSRGVSTFRL